RLALLPITNHQSRITNHQSPITALLYSRHGQDALQSQFPQPRQGLRAVRAARRQWPAVGVRRGRRAGVRRARRHRGRSDRRTPARRVRQHPRAAPADAGGAAHRGSREEGPIGDPRCRIGRAGGHAFPAAGQAALSALHPLLLVGAGGAAGAIARHLLASWTMQAGGAPAFPLGTFVVNITGCLLAGVLAGFAERHAWFDADVRLLLMVGLLGGFTTFSAFGLETVQLLRRGDWLLAGGYAGGSV